MAMERRDDKVVFEIRAHLGEISKKKDGWKKELNLVCWNGQETPKFDIREWSEDHTKMSRGITLFDNEMRKITQFYNQFCNARIISESKNSSNAAAKAGLRAGEEPGGALDAGNMPSRSAYTSSENATRPEGVSSVKSDQISGASDNDDAEVPFESASDVSVGALTDAEAASNAAGLSANF